MIREFPNDLKAYTKPNTWYIMMILEFPNDFKAYLKLCI